MAMRLFQRCSYCEGFMLWAEYYDKDLRDYSHNLCELRIMEKIKNER